MRGYEHKPGLSTPKFDKYNQDNLFVSVDDSSIPAELKKCNETQKKICTDFWFCTLICNIKKPVKSYIVNFKGSNLVSRLGILKEFDKQIKVIRLESIAQILACKNWPLKNAQYLCKAQI